VPKFAWFSLKQRERLFQTRSEQSLEKHSEGVQRTEARYVKRDKLPVYKFADGTIRAITQVTDSDTDHHTKWDDMQLLGEVERLLADREFTPEHIPFALPKRFIRIFDQSGKVVEAVDVTGYKEETIERLLAADKRTGTVTQADPPEAEVLVY
jgi:hypothetical protein